MRTPAELTELFRASGLKVTPQRQCLFRILHDSPEHPTAEAVYAIARQEMPTLSLRTVYQTLNDLAAMGELAQLRVGRGPTRFDPNVAPHHHLVCTSCGSILDVRAELAAVSVPHGALPDFEVDSTEVVFRGRCRTCSEAASTAPAGGATPRTRPTNPTNTEVSVHHG